jgi:hypothetical protein
VEEEDIRTNIVQMQVNMMGIMINLNKKEEIKIKIKNLVVKLIKIMEEEKNINKNIDMYFKILKVNYL